MNMRRTTETYKMSGGQLKYTGHSHPKAQSINAPSKRATAPRLTKAERKHNSHRFTTPPHQAARKNARIGSLLARGF